MQATRQPRKMPTFTDRIEAYLGKLFYSQRGRDSQLFTRDEIFNNIEPSIPITSPDVGQSGSTMEKRYTQDAASDFPALSWEQVPEAQEYILVIEDPDAPLPFPVVHGLLYGIFSDTTNLSQPDFEAVDTVKHTIKTGSVKYGKNLRQSVYDGPKPILNHGEHRYFYQLIALKQPLKNLPAYPDKKTMLKNIKETDSVLAWGEWIGVYERKLE